MAHSAAVAAREGDPILAALAVDPRFRSILGRMQKDVDVQPARAHDRGLLDIDALLAPRR